MGRKQFDMAYYSRKSARIPNYDYARENYYFVTICTHNRRCIFGKPNYLNCFGIIAEQEIKQIPKHYDSVKIDHYVVMPNHIHMIVVLENADQNLNQIIAQYKSGVTRRIREKEHQMIVWQRSYHDHVIRDQKGYENIFTYIDGNPLNWDKDCFFMDTV